MDPEIKDRLSVLIAAQTRTDQSVNGLTATVSRYVDAADARMRRIEGNPDLLIRAITREHTNGHTTH